MVRQREWLLEPMRPRERTELLRARPRGQGLGNARRRWATPRAMLRVPKRALALEELAPMPKWMGPSGWTGVRNRVEPLVAGDPDTTFPL